ncbi:MAG TPA: hypothetical protein VIL97_04190, partial [Thermoanaerobaculia bacterium]
GIDGTLAVDARLLHRVEKLQRVYRASGEMDEPAAIPDVHAALLHRERHVGNGHDGLFAFDSIQRPTRAPPKRGRRRLE